MEALEGLISTGNRLAWSMEPLAGSLLLHPPKPSHRGLADMGFHPRLGLLSPGIPSQLLPEAVAPWSMPVLAGMDLTFP